jgi:hypothetical protein
MANADRHIGIWAGWIAGPAFGVVTMAAPDYLKLNPVLVPYCFWVGIAIFAVSVGAIVYLISTERRKELKRMLSIAAMAVGAVVFAIGLAGYFWPSNNAPRAETTSLTQITAVAQGDLLLECQQMALPEVGLPNESQLMMISPFRFDKEGTVGFATRPSQPGQPFKWPDEWKGKIVSSVRCKLTNYGNTPLFNIELAFDTTFKIIRPGENPGSVTADKVINVVKGSVLPITKLEPGGDRAYVFYIHNQGRDLVHTAFADTATARPAGVQSRGIHPS